MYTGGHTMSSKQDIFNCLFKKQYHYCAAIMVSTWSHPAWLVILSTVTKSDCSQFRIKIQFAWHKKTEKTFEVAKMIVIVCTDEEKRHGRAHTYRMQYLNVELLLLHWCNAQIIKSKFDGIHWISMSCNDDVLDITAPRRSVNLLRKDGRWNSSQSSTQVIYPYK